MKAGIPNPVQAEFNNLALQQRLTQEIRTEDVTLPARDGSKGFVCRHRRKRTRKFRLFKKKKTHEFRNLWKTTTTTTKKKKKKKSPIKDAANKAGSCVIDKLLADPGLDLDEAMAISAIFAVIEHSNKCVSTNDGEGA